jgi:hypothetical protein
MSLFGRRRRAERQPPVEVYAGLRQQVLRLTADQLGRDDPILALLMETGYPEGAATLVAVADGTTSLYLSSGGGVIGAGGHAAVAEASRRWRDAAVDLLPALAPVEEPPTPGDGITQFVAVTPGGLRGAAEREQELGGGRHPLSPLFYAGQDVITQIRLAEGERRD